MFFFLRYEETGQKQYNGTKYICACLRKRTGLVKFAVFHRNYPQFHSDTHQVHSNELLLKKSFTIWKNLWNYPLFENVIGYKTTWKLNCFINCLPLTKLVVFFLLDLLRFSTWKEKKKNTTWWLQLFYCDSYCWLIVAISLQSPQDFLPQ